jgi:hypothetical protein
MLATNPMPSAVETIAAIHPIAEIRVARRPVTSRKTGLSDMGGAGSGGVSGNNDVEIR